MTEKRSQSKTVVITGCTRGLGRVMTKEFHEIGWNVAGCGRSQEQIDQLKEIFPAITLFSAVDVTSDKSVKEFAADTIKTFGAPDLVLNNAALINDTAPLWEVPEEEFSRVIDVNIKGVHNVIRHFTPAMIEAQKGVIVNFSSGWGRSTSPEVAPYCATKFAIEGLTQAMSQELPRGLAAVALSPGVIDTDMLRQCWAEGAAGYPSPEEWGKSAVPFIAKLGPKDNGKSLTTP
ncbi:MAG: SDR family oxidoreductase [Verrucomicrobiota bacterium]